LTNVNIDRFDELERAFTVKTVRDYKGELDLRYGIYYRGTGEPSRYLFFANGRAEWLEKYCYLVGDLALDDDVAFVVWDHRGQGGSGGTQAWIDNYDHYAKDAARIVQVTAGQKPYAFMAHSMGGLISVYATLKGLISPQAMVLGSPLFGLPNKPVPRPLAKPISKLLTKMMLGAVSSGAGSFTARPFESNDLTQSREMYERIQRSPYKIPGATFEWVSATFTALEVIFDEQKLSSFTCPTLVLGGTAETVVEQKAFERWVAKAQKQSSAPVRLTMIPGARHELFSEIPKYYEVAMKESIAWIKEYFR
jgi:lysophospholipase